MKAAIIWDLDGTLIDSYGVIVNSLYRIYHEKGVEIDKKEILSVCINESVSAFIKQAEAEFGIPFDDLKDRYSHISHQEVLSIKAMEHAAEIMDYLHSNGFKNYVFTHRGVTTETVLKNVKLFKYFDYIVNSQDGFARKPDPEGLNYIIEKFNLDRENTYYVGDRPLDIECANNAHIKSVMFIPKGSPASPTGKETYVANDLLKIKEIIIYLASSTTEDAWKGVIKEYNLTGPDCVHYNLPGNQQTLVEQFLKVEGYPTYRLLNRNGALLDVQCYPGNIPALIETLKKL